VLLSLEEYKMAHIENSVHVYGDLS